MNRRACPRGLKIAVYGEWNTVVDLRGPGAQMTDEQLAIQAVSHAQRILEEYLEPRPRNNERVILDKLVEVLECPELLVAVTRMQSRH